MKVEKHVHKYMYKHAYKRVYKHVYKHESFIKQYIVLSKVSILIMNIITVGCVGDRVVRS